MNYKLFIILLLFPFFFSSCGNWEKTDLSFSKTFQLKSKVLQIKGNIGDPISISCSDSVLVLGNYLKEPLVRYYDLKGNVIKSAILKGLSNDKLMVAGNIQCDSKSKLFYINDFLTNRIAVFDSSNPYILKLLESSFFKSTKRQDFDKCLVGNNVFIAESRSPEGRLILFDSLGNKLGAFLEFPEKKLIDTPLTDESNSILYSVVFALNPQKNKIAMATTGAGIVDVATINSKMIVLDWSIREFLPKDIGLLPVGKEVLPIRGAGSRLGYIGISTTSKYIFTLFSGKTLSVDNCNYGKTIRVFDWKKNKPFELQLDRYLRGFVVCNSKKKIFGIALNTNGTYEIVEYDISFINTL